MKNILVVDDNWMILHSLSSFLGSLLKGYNVLTAENGEKAVEILESNPVSLILTDLEMPRMDGYQVLEYSKKEFPSIPVLIMTGSWSIDLELLVNKAGVAHCIQKPFRFEDLADIVTKTLREGPEICRSVSLIGRTLELTDHACGSECK